MLVGWSKKRHPRAQLRGPEADSAEAPKTTMACPGLAMRCNHAAVGNPTSQAYLPHGTNPTAAVAILNRSFTVDLAGKGAGSMFGPGVYLAEASTKAEQ